MFDEILVNAADNKINHSEQTKIEITVDDYIQIVNDGCGIYPTYIEGKGYFCDKIQVKVQVYSKKIGFVSFLIG